MNDDQIIYKNIYEIKYRGIKLRKKTFKNIESKTNNNKKNKNQNQYKHKLIKHI
jgi:hypothetical protein